MHAKLLGSIAYARSTDRFAAAQAIFITKLDSIEVANTVAFIERGANASKKPFFLANLAKDEAATRLIANNLTGIGGANSQYGSNWNKNSVSEGPTPDSVTNVFTSSHGANLCHRYMDGSLTDTPLWPWPMNQRIKDAMIESGRSAVDVTATVEEMFGPIPASCKTARGNAAQFR